MTATSTGVGEPKLITSLTMSAGSNDSLTSGSSAASSARSRSLRASISTLAPPHRDAEDGLLGPAGPLVDRVDRVARRDQADVADRDRHVLAADVAGDPIERGDRQPLGPLVPGAVGRPQSELEPPGVDLREDLQPERHPHHHDDRRRPGDVGGHDQPAEPDDGADGPRRRRRPSGRTPIAAAAPVGRAVVMVPQQPDRQHGHERAREQVGRDHREADGQRERDEQRCAAPCMKNDGRNTASTQSIASNRGTAVCWLPRRTARATEPVSSIW